MYCNSVGLFASLGFSMRKIVQVVILRGDNVCLNIFIYASGSILGVFSIVFPHAKLGYYIREAEWYFFV